MSPIYSFANRDPIRARTKAFNFVTIVRKAFAKLDCTERFEIKVNSFSIHVTLDVYHSQPDSLFLRYLRIDKAPALRSLSNIPEHITSKRLSEKDYTIQRKIWDRKNNPSPTKEIIHISGRGYRRRLMLAQDEFKCLKRENHQMVTALVSSKSGQRFQAIYPLFVQLPRTYSVKYKK